MPRKKPTRREIYKRIAELEKTRDNAHLKLEMLKDLDGYNGYHYISGKCIENGLKFLSLSPEEYKKWKEKNQYTTREENVLHRFVKKYAVKDASGYLNEWPVREKIQKKIKVIKSNFESIYNSSKKDISALKSRWLTIKAEDNRNNLGPSIRDKMMARSQDLVNNFAYCTRSGRRVEVSFEMQRKDPTVAKNQWAGTQVTTPKTFAEIAIAKLGGYMFDSNFNKKIKGNQYVYGSSIRADGTGLLAAANSGKASPEVMASAQQFLAKMKDSIFCTYVDTGKRSSFKIKDIFTIDPEKSSQLYDGVKVQKPKIKAKRAWEKHGFDKFYELNKIPENMYNAGDLYFVLKLDIPVTDRKVFSYIKSNFPKNNHIYPENYSNKASDKDILRVKQEIIKRIGEQLA